MKILSLILALIGIITLLIILLISKPIKINSESDLNSTLANQKVLISGKVTDEKILKGLERKVFETVVFDPFDN